MYIDIYILAFFIIATVLTRILSSKNVPLLVVRTPFGKKT